MMKNSNLLLGYNYDEWYGYGLKEPICADISPNINSQTIICGMSGSDKSYCTNILFARLFLVEQQEKEIAYFADFKQDDQFSYLRECPRYYPYDKSLEALDIVYSHIWAVSIFVAVAVTAACQ